MTASRPFMLDMSRTTTIIGELIQLITEEEDLTTALGTEAFAYYRAGLFYDEVTLDICRRVEGASAELRKTKREHDQGIEEGFANAEPGPLTKLRRSVVVNLMARETAQQERAVREQYDELANRVKAIANNDPRSLSVKMLKMCQTLDRVKEDIDLRWKELEQRTKSERKGPMFILILNMFLVNFFKFSNHTWFRHWIARLKTFQHRVGERIHRDIEHDLDAAEEPAMVSGAGAEDLDDGPVILPRASATPDPFALHHPARDAEDIPVELPPVRDVSRRDPGQKSVRPPTIPAPPKAPSNLSFGGTPARPAPPPSSAPPAPPRMSFGPNSTDADQDDDLRPPRR